jgi:hypothetical protein
VKGHGATFRDNWKTKGTLKFRDIVNEDTMSTQMPKVHHLAEILLASDSLLHIMLVLGKILFKIYMGQLYGKIIHKITHKIVQIRPIWSRTSNLMRRGIRGHETSQRTESSLRWRQGSSSATRECSSSLWSTNGRNAWNRDTKSHHRGRLGAIRASCPPGKDV